MWRSRFMGLLLAKSGLSTSMDPATIGFTNASVDRADGNSRVMKQNTCAYGVSRNLFPLVWFLVMMAA